MNAAELKKGLQAKPPTLKMHQEIVALKERGVESAEMAVHRAKQRLADAVDASVRAKADMADWVKANPEAVPTDCANDDQIEMFP